VPCRAEKSTSHVAQAAPRDEGTAARRRAPDAIPGHLEHTTSCPGRAQPVGDRGAERARISFSGGAKPPRAPLPLSAGSNPRRDPRAQPPSGGGAWAGCRGGRVPRRGPWSSSCARSRPNVDRHSLEPLRPGCRRAGRGVEDDARLAILESLPPGPSLELSRLTEAGPPPGPPRFEPRTGGNGRPLGGPRRRRCGPFPPSGPMCPSRETETSQPLPGVCVLEPRLVSGAGRPGIVREGPASAAV